jgi:uncharacterized membrane protein
MVFFRHALEKRMFRLGLFLFGGQVVALLILWLFYPDLTKRVVAVIAASLLFGRTASILTGLEVGLASYSITLVLLVCNSTWLLIFFPLVVASYYQVVEKRVIGRIVESTKRIAEAQKAKTSKYGPWGLAFFIWLPFPWTGALIGSVIGFLFGMPTKRIVAVAIPSMLIGVVSWVVGFRYLIVFTGTVGKTASLAFLVSLFLFPVLKNRNNQPR